MCGGKLDESVSKIWGTCHLVFIEMKVQSKTSLDQFMKYLLLSILADQQADKSRKLHLLYISKNGLHELFEEKYSSMDEAKDALITMVLPTISKNGGMDLLPYHDQIRTAVNRVNLCFCTYSDFYNLLQKKMAQANHPVMIKLMQGICRELEDRDMSHV